MKRVLIIGGYGNTGRAISRLLLQHLEEIELLIGGRNIDQASSWVRQLDLEFGPGRALPYLVDMASTESLDKVIPLADFVVVASGTINHTKNLVEALLRWGRDGMDTQLSSPEKLQILWHHSADFRGKQVCYITDGGFHPGLPAAMVRYAARKMDVLEKGNVYSLLNINWKELNFSPETRKEFLLEFRHFRSDLYEDGRWETASPLKVFPFTFDPPFGRLYCSPMFMEELDELTLQLPELRETGFFVSSLNPLVDTFVMPLVMMGAKVLPKKWAGPLSRLLLWSFSFNKEPFQVQLVADCQGKTDGETDTLRLTLSHSDGYWLTAAPVAACIRQYFHGEIRRPGLWFQGNVLDPSWLFEDLKTMGVSIKEERAGRQTLLEKN